MKNDINQKAVAAALGHSKSIITVDRYTDMQSIIADCVGEIQSFIEEVHPYDRIDAEMLQCMFHETILLEDDETTLKKETVEFPKEDKTIVGIKVYDYSDIAEMEDIVEWYLGEEIENLSFYKRYSIQKS